MTTPPFLEAPSSMCPNSLVISLKHVVGRTASPFTLESEGYKWPGEQWAVDFRLPPAADRDTFEEWLALALGLKGKWGSFLMGFPTYATPRGVGTGTPLIDGANQTGSTIDTKGWSNSITGILKQGDMVQFGTGTASRLHKLLKTPNSDGTGRATLEVTPDVPVAFADSSAITVVNPRGVFRMVENTVSWSIEPLPLYRFSFQAEAVI